MCPVATAPLSRSMKWATIDHTAILRPGLPGCGRRLQSFPQRSSEGRRPPFELRRSAAGPGWIWRLEVLVSASDAPSKRDLVKT
jgi:hypothetical protein